MNEAVALTFPARFAETVRKFGGNDSLSFVGEKSMSYEELNIRIHALMSFLEKLDVKPGEKIAILSGNMPNWSLAYLAISFMGAVAVPMLPDFTPGEIENILNHSESRGIFVSEALLAKLKNVNSNSLKFKIKTETLSLVSTDAETLEFDPESKPAGKYEVREEDLAAIIYTSGTTGSSKGVMLTHKNISVNVLQSIGLHHVNERDRFLSLLPLSHTLENTVGFMIGIFQGSAIHYLRKPPTAAIILPALLEVRPTIILSVPLIIEKIYFNKILPTFRDSFLLSSLYKIPFFRKKLNQAAGKKLMKTFGGELQFFGIGGAKLNNNVEKFLIEAKFPYAIGYGLTETAPLLAGAVPGKTKLGSTGLACKWVELKINDPDPNTGEGEIWAKGPNVMRGYYKEPILTAEVLTEDGWFRTGDLGVFDEDNYLHIKGRLKNMIVGSSGENIYPEEIEFLINDLKHVVESLVVEQKGKLVALVHLNREELEESYLHLKEEVTQYVEEKMEEILKDIHKSINERVNKFSRINQVILQTLPFQRTATQKIKRFLYS